MIVFRKVTEVCPESRLVNSKKVVYLLQKRFDKSSREGRDEVCQVLFSNFAVTSAVSLTSFVFSRVLSKLFGFVNCTCCINNHVYILVFGTDVSKQCFEKALQHFIVNAASVNDAEAELKFFQNRLPEYFSDNNIQVATLNAYGSLISVSKQLLMEYPQSLLNVLVNGKIGEKDPAFPIDIDPNVVRLMLDFYKYGMVNVDNYTGSPEDLLKYADYFCLEELEAILDTCFICNKFYCLFDKYNCVNDGFHRNSKCLAKLRSKLDPLLDSLGMFRKYLRSPATLEEIRATENRLGVVITEPILQLLLLYQGTDLCLCGPSTTDSKSCDFTERVPSSAALSKVSDWKDLYSSRYNYFFDSYEFDDDFEEISRRTGDEDSVDYDEEKSDLVADSFDNFHYRTIVMTEVKIRRWSLWSKLIVVGFATDGCDAYRDTGVHSNLFLLSSIDWTFFYIHTDYYGNPTLYSLNISFEEWLLTRFANEKQWLKYFTDDMKFFFSENPSISLKDFLKEFTAATGIEPKDNFCDKTVKYWCEHYMDEFSKSVSYNVNED